MSPVDTIAVALEATAQAHHQAFLSTDGADPDWPIWYAKDLQSRIGDVLTDSRCNAELSALLLNLDAEHGARAPDEPWARFYAEQIAERCVATAQERLALYESATCPFCIRVRRAIEALGIEVEGRDVWENPQYRQELVAARGRATVPVLQCTAPDGTVRWLPESRDIIRYLQTRFG